MRTASDVATELVGKRVLTIVSNPDTGYSLLQLGSWRPRARPITNPNLTAQQQNYQGTDSIFVQCPWELDSPNDLREDETLPFRPGERLQLLDVLTGSIITAARFEGPALRLSLSFDNAMHLTLRPRQVSDQPGYSIGLGDRYWTVYAQGRVEDEQV